MLSFIFFLIFFLRLCYQSYDSLSLQKGLWSFPPKSISVCLRWICFLLKECHINIHVWHLFEMNIPGLIFSSILHHRTNVTYHIPLHVDSFIFNCRKRCVVKSFQCCIWISWIRNACLEIEKLKLKFYFVFHAMSFRNKWGSGQCLFNKHVFLKDVILFFQ